MLLHSIKTDYLEKMILDIKIDNLFIKKVNSYKYFDITLGSNLNLTEHIERFKTKLLISIGILYKTRYCLNGIALYYIFNLLLMSHVRYSLLCWSRAYKD